MNTLTTRELKANLHYDPETGLFRWLVDKPKRRKGDVAGRIHSGRYIQIMVNGAIFYAHRLAWFYVHGKWPSRSLDHRDGDGFNNRIANLREATNSENNRNRSFNPASGIKGVRRSGSSWVATITENGRLKHLGTFKTKDEAKQAADHARINLHGEFAKL